MPELRRAFPDRIDRYALRSLVGPLALSLGVLLLAQLLERLLRLFDMAAATGASLSIVLQMAATLVPHYLGLAVPTAFFASIFMAVAKLGDDNELDALLATGRSIARARSALLRRRAVADGVQLLPVRLSAADEPLRLSPCGQCSDAGRVNARVEDNRFVSAGHGFTLSADAVGPDGRQLTGVSSSGAPTVERRSSRPSGAASCPRRRIRDCSSSSSEGRSYAPIKMAAFPPFRFADGRIDDDFTAEPPPSAPGAIRRVSSLCPSSGAVSPLRMKKAARSRRRHQRSGELHGRLARVVLPPLLPLIAPPPGYGRQTRWRAPGVVFAALALLALEPGTAASERALPRVARAPGLITVWTPLALFALLGNWLFRSSLKWLGDNPIMRSNT